MTYTEIHIPFLGPPSKRSKDEIRDYFKWFMNSIPERIEILSRAIRATTGFEGWNPDFSPQSLDKLEMWFQGEVSTRIKTEEEMNGDRKLLPFIEEPKREQLSDRTLSLSMDIGMYVSQVFISNVPNLKWALPLYSKRDADYGQPVLNNCGPAPLNPIRIIVMRAYGIARKARNKGSLRDDFTFWVRQFHKSSARK